MPTHQGFDSRNDYRRETAFVPGLFNAIERQHKDIFLLEVLSPRDGFLNIIEDRVLCGHNYGESFLRFLINNSSVSRSVSDQIGSFCFRLKS